jgi:signal transduction histidine kinase/CheY-like chemotaxis protein
MTLDKKLEQLHALITERVPAGFKKDSLPLVFVVGAAIALSMAMFTVVDYHIYADYPAFTIFMSLSLAMLAIRFGLKIEIATKILMLVCFFTLLDLVWNTGGISSVRLTWVFLMPTVIFYFVGVWASLFSLVMILLVFGLATAANVTGHLQMVERIGTVYIIHNWVSLSLISMFLFVIPLTYQLKKNNLLSKLKQQHHALAAQKVELEQAQSQRDEFISCVSHELRTPMNAIIGLNEWLSFRVDDDPDARQLVKQCSQSAEHLMTVLNDVLDYSQLQSGSIRLNRQTADLHACVYNAFEMLTPKAQAKGLEYECSIDVSVPRWVSTDQHRLVQVLVNLLSNAIKFTERGRVSLTLTHHVHRVRFEIQDTGIGIAKDQQDKIFDRYTQIENPTHSNHFGNGLGLSISQQLVGLLGGELRFESAPRKGSNFYFELLMPAQTCPPDNKPSMPQAPQSSAWSVVFLVVDDHPINRLLLRKILMVHWPHAEVIEATNGSEALSSIQTRAVDAVFMDMLMPVMDGIEATQLIRQLPRPLRNVPILGLTANIHSEDLARFKSAGLDTVMLKPFNVSQLCAELDRILVQKKAQQVF